MNNSNRHHGLTLIEIMVVVFIIVLMAGIATPAIRMLFNSYQTSGGTRAMISSVLASARAMATCNQKYTGVRFQYAYNASAQYIITIVHDETNTGLADGFRAVEGSELIKLPDAVGVMEIVNNDIDIDTNDKLIDKTTFSIIFSPSGKLILRDVQTRNRDAIASGLGSMDDIFNTAGSLTSVVPYGMFLQDYNSSVDGQPAQEKSKGQFVIYDRVRFDAAPKTSRWTDYLSGVQSIHISPYTGRIINR